MKISVVLCVLTPTPFLRAMTEFAIKTLRLHADNEFELVVVEADHDYFNPEHTYHFDPSTGGPAGNPQSDPLLRVNTYLNFTPKIGCVKELNKGLEAATGDFIVCTGNDVIVPPHWDTELLRCFDERKDCAIASLSALEPGWVVGPPQTMDMIVEGNYSPFCMFRKGETFDEAYTKIYQDSDLIMKIYERGQRAYRSCRAHVHHLCRMTSDRVNPTEHDRQLAQDEQLFYSRWEKSPLMMFGMIRYGRWQYGLEHQSFTTPINRHLLPSKSGVW